MHLTDERVASAELDYLADALRPACQLGQFYLTGHLGRSATALLYTARGGAFGSDDGVLKLTGSAYAPILQREVSLLQEAAAAGIEGIVRPVSGDLLWLSAGGERADRPAAAIALPFLSGGDLAALAQRASRTGTLGAALALAAARPLGEALRGLLTELSRPVVDADLRPQNVMLPSPGTSATDLQLIDLDSAHELETDLQNPSPDAARLLAEDVRGYGEILLLLAGGPSTGNRPLDTLIVSSREQRFTSLADPRLWHTLADAEQAQVNDRGWLSSLLRGFPRR